MAESGANPVHVIAHFTIVDQAKYDEYAAGFLAVLGPYDGRVVTVDDHVTVLEGEWTPGRTVVLQFASEAEFSSWWQSPEYQELAKLRIDGTTTHSVILVHPLALHG